MNNLFPRSLFIHDNLGLIAYRLDKKKMLNCKQFRLKYKQYVISICRFFAFKTLLSLINIEETVSGGSVANSIVGLSQLGDDVGFIGKVSDDNLGQKYEEGLKKEKVNYFYKKKKKLFLQEVV